MELKSFSIQKYRSITAAKKIPFGKSTILVGPNNEGKSNILRALVTAMNILIRERRRRFFRKGSGVARSRYVRREYDWETDFPVALQEKDPDGQTKLTLEFALTTVELKDFRQDIGSKLTGTLPIRITLGPSLSDTAVVVAKPGATTLSKKSDQIAKFVTDRIDFQHIEAVRTANSAEEVVAEMVARELDDLEENHKYQAALARLDKLQQPILSTISDSIQKTLQQFLHDVKQVTVDVPSAARYYAVRRSCEITVDDGTPTLLKYKGDGAQSLAALGIIRYAAERGARGKNLVIAIEEPESHLHPNAIHELKQVVDELSAKHQVLITTHNPLFVDRRNIKSNIIVENKKAKPAKSIEQIRDILGVRASDNLRHAEIVLLVEGEDDRVALSSLLRHNSPTVCVALDQGTLAVDTLAGGSNLAYKITQVRDAICLYHVFLDDDKAGRSAFEKARLQGLITDAEVNFCICSGLNETELEDLYDPSVYGEILQNKYRVSIKSPKFKGKKKWSNRVRDCFRNCGKQWDERVEVEVKWAVADAVSRAPGIALHPKKRATFDALALALEERLKAKEQA